MAKVKTNALGVLVDDHRNVDKLFQEYEETSSPSLRRELVDRITKDLSIHCSVEEQIFYPVVRQTLGQDGFRMVDEALRAHRQIKELLAHLERMDATSMDYDQEVRTLIREVRLHVEEEENEMFPKLRLAIDEKRLDEIGEALEKAKKVAPTRPHPIMPDQAPANIVAGVAAGAVDRTFDTLDDMPEEQRSKLKIGLAIAGAIGAAAGAVFGIVKIVKSRRREPETPLERIKGKALEIGEVAVHVGANAIATGADKIASGAEIVRDKARRVS
jgi:hemerythrin superfamily protein